MSLKAESEIYSFEKPKSSKNQCCSFFGSSSGKPLKDYGHASVVEGKKPLNRTVPYAFFILSVS